tara:strand:- start:10 stop:942 length:933 start_codon:yes stop_codon:yes gene_type:complete
MNKLNPNFLNKLACPENLNLSLEINKEQTKLISSSENKIFNIYNGVPSLINEIDGPLNQDWNLWDTDNFQKMGDSYYKRAVGDLPEKESSKSYARLLKNKGLYKKGDSLLDIGCATGHFLRSFRSILDENINYTGVDSDAQFLKWGSEIFGISDNCNFVHADAMKLPFKNKSFNISIVNLFHFFENIELALKESMRVTNNFLVWRTPIGEVNYIVKMVYEHSYDKLGTITPKRTDLNYSLYQLFSKKYIEGLVKHLGGKLLFIEKDNDFNSFDNNKVDGFDGIPATKTVNGMQINGNLVLDWHYVAIKCS